LGAVILVVAKNRARALRSLVVSGVVFCIVAAPEVLAVSRRVGKPSLGEAGKLNFAWHVNGTPFLWNGPDGFTAGQTRVRVLNPQPLVYEFADSSGSTLPVWYDPAHWQQALGTHISVRELVVSIFKRLQEVFRMFEDVVPLLVGLFVLMSTGVRRRAGRLLEHGVLLLGLWAVVTCFFFMLVHVEPRYIATPIFLICLVVYRIAELAADGSAFRLVTRLVGLMMLITLIPPTERALMHLTQQLRGRAQPDEHVAMAAELRRFGIQPGDRIAVAWLCLRKLLRVYRRRSDLRPGLRPRYLRRCGLARPAGQLSRGRPLPPRCPTDDPRVGCPPSRRCQSGSHTRGASGVPARWMETVGGALCRADARGCSRRVKQK
jgi:hypothetical protein